MRIQHFFDPVTYTLTYVVYDPASHDAVIVDPVLDYDPAASVYSFESMNQVVQFIRDKQLNLHFIIETHAHADHLSPSQELKRIFPRAKLLIHKNISKVQSVFQTIYNIPTMKTDGSQFDVLANDYQDFEAGTLKFKALPTPGHTEACTSYLFADAVFTGDALFMPDYGVGRCDFPNGSAKALFHSVTKVLYSLPPSTRVYTGHDYQPGGRPLRFESTIEEEKKMNIHINASTSETDFVKFRTERDKTLSAPRLLLPSIQVNIQGGQFPNPEANGMSYLKIPFRKKNA